METKPIRAIIEEVLAGQIRIPAFQRGFVWEPERVAQLMDSIYKKYPFGVLLFWRSREKLRSERNLGPFALPQPKEDYPLDYVLDGQQRITSIFAVFQTDLRIPNSGENWNWRDIYFDVLAADNAQDAQFFALQANEVDIKRHFPLKAIFDPLKYREASERFSDRKELLIRIDSMQAVFKEIQIPVQVIKTDNKSMVAIIFERINRQGVPLDTLQLLSAWTWSEDFHLQNQFQDLAEELEDYGFNQQESEENLLLRCTAAILVGDPSPEALVNLNGSEVRGRFQEVVNGIKGALDFLRANFCVERLSNLPFQTILVPLSVLFAVRNNEFFSLTDNQRQELARWFWRLCFTRRYSSGVLRNLKEDIDEIIVLRQRGTSGLSNFSGAIPRPEFFLENKFAVSNVNTKTFILMLAQACPLNFISGAPVDLSAKLKDYNRTEFHHLFPRAYLEEIGMNTGDPDVNCLANFAFLASIDNKRIGGKSPSLYRALMPEDVEPILKHALCPLQLFSDNFREFTLGRSLVLWAFGVTLMKNGRVNLESSFTETKDRIVFKNEVVEVEMDLSHPVPNYKYKVIATGGQHDEGSVAGHVTIG